MSLYLILFTGALAFFLSLYSTPIMREAALRFGIVDAPDGRLKVHPEPVAYLGGLAIYLAFLVALAITFPFSRPALGLLLSGTIIVLLGLVDDFGYLTPRVKLAGQILATLVLFKADVYIQLELIPPLKELIPVTWRDHTPFLQYIGDLPLPAYAVSALWLIGMSNAFNFLDIMDGLAAGVAGIAAAAFTVVAVFNDNLLMATMAAALTGAAFGFLRFNKPPARIYMGDTGSLFLGFMLAALAMNGAYTRHTTWGVFAPIFILGFPLFEIAFTTLIRWKKGLNLMWGSPDHVPYRLEQLGLSTHRVLLVLYATGVATAVAGVVLMRAPASTAPWLAGVGILATIVAAALLARIEIEKRPAP